MPQKVSLNFDSQINASTMSDIESRENKRLMQNNEGHGSEITFLNSITNELNKLMNDMKNGYDAIHIKFMHLVNELEARSKRNSQNNSNGAERSPQPNKKFQILAHKFKTPIDHRTRTVCETQDVSKKPLEACANTKKRSAVSANLSNLGDENKDESIIECDEEKQKTVKKKTTKSKKIEGGATEKKKKKKKKVNNENEDENKMEIEIATVDNGVAVNSQDNSLDEEENKKVTKNPPKKIKLNKKKPKQDAEENNNNQQVIEVMDTTLKSDLKQDGCEPKKNVKQSSKKQKTSDASVTGDSTKLKKKKKKNSNMLSAGEHVSATTPSNNTNIANKISINSVLRLSHKKKSLLPQYTKTNPNLAKTPSNENRLSSIKYLQSTIKKSIMRPVQTRARAAAQATTKTLITNTAATTSGTQLKTSAVNASVNSTQSKHQSNENIIANKSVASNVKSLASKFNSIATPNQQNRRVSVLQQTASKLIKATLRNSIDKRKALCKGKETLKQSLTKEKAIAFLKTDEHKKSDEESSDSSQSRKNIPVTLINESAFEKEGRASSSSRRSIRITSDTIANVNNNAEEDLIHEMKNKTPKVNILKMPSSMFAHGTTVTYSASKFNKLNENQRTITQTISMSSIKSTPSRTFNQTSLTNLQASVQKSAIKPSFVKFLERNTPSKLTHTALEEKRRAELMSKDNKEKERLLEMERQKNEKREEIKRRNEEKLKKAAEQKLQKEAEFKQKIENKNNSVLANTTNNPHAVKKTFLGSSSNQPSFHPQSLTNKLQSAYASSNDSIVTFKQPVPIPKLQVTQEDMSDFKKSIQNYRSITNLQPTVNLANDFSLKVHNLNDQNNYNKFSSHYSKANNNLETTYILNSPSSSSSSTSSKTNMQQSLLKASFSNYEVTPLQPLKLKNDDNYDVSELQSGDDTDDEEEPSKPLPLWAKEPFISDKAKAQSCKMINFTRLFKGASNYEVDLEGIFKVKRKKFTERSSSAIWETPPVWAGLGLNGEESFYRVRKGF